MVKKYIFPVLMLLLHIGLYGQDQEKLGPVSHGVAKPSHTAPLSTKELVAPNKVVKEVNPKNRSANRVVPGKGYPKSPDAAWQKKPGTTPTKEPLLTFDAANTFHKPTDPTGAVGPNHYVNAWNSAFAIYDKQGNILSPPADLESLGGEFTNEDLGDPIVVYDQFADRFLITQFSDSPNSLLVAISQGPDPVNDGWYTYRFETGTFPDYPKFFVWSDGYYVTTNQDPEDEDIHEVVFVLERDKMLQGEEAQHVGFPLPGVRINGFYSPAAFNAVGEEMPAPGNSPILYFQDDAWLGVNEDILKIWLVNVDWNNIANSTISESQELGPSQGVTPFHSTFDGGSFRNLPQPGDAPDVDALQGAIMYPTSYRRFETHNSVVFNFVVDVDPSLVEHAGIRWYELRQDATGGPWSVYQEGTYAPDINDRWCGSIGIDKNGNIGMGFTVVNDNPEEPIYPTLRYTGRYAGDPLGIMTLQEETTAESSVPNDSNRYGDYSHTSIDPVDNETFWFNGEYFSAGSRLNKVGVFKIAPQFAKDVGVTDILRPISSTLGQAEQVTIVIRNFGSEPQSNFPVWYRVGTGPMITEIFTGTIPPTSQMEFTFSQTVDLSQEGQSYTIAAKTNLEGDMEFSNDFQSKTVKNLPPNDIGVTEIHSPVSGSNLGMEEVVVTIKNFGGEPQSNFEIAYSINEGPFIRETVTQTLLPASEISYVFNNDADLSESGVYNVVVSTFLAEDSEPDNDSTQTTIANLDCIPDGSSCAFSDGINSFYLEEIVNENIYCTTGYNNFIGLSTRLDRQRGVYQVGVKSRATSEFSMWIDFNDNAVFEPSEMLVRSGDIISSSAVTIFEFTIPEDAPLGEHILRARAGDVRPQYRGELNDPCDVMEYGTTDDYSVIIVDGLDESELQQGELVITSSEEDIFEINFTTTYQRPLWLTVHNVLGQKLVENMLRKNYSGYSYTLDMSYAAPGVYLVRLGTRDEGRVQRIIVR
ncbi:GEVED domain-containing protein [Salinimicrobium oceani]|uniref:T9SS type A sorting domain-containing protein n=1 Tax=Salinimicrobium oceani TaxID=2722702 RepID=A0ABX1CXE0_9FLAO|nr:GEVED domain-containing protein [Salinimicrobium oceani]NJW52932.1 T9SS type A sorting domain-containing protein [Salinimicrobium oceani]